MHNQLTEKRSGRPKRRTEPSHTLRVNETLYLALAALAQAEHRSVRRQVEMLLVIQLASRGGAVNG
jgi:hypothetical protein